VIERMTNRMNNHRITAALALSLLHALASAYETDTHRLLTCQALKRSVVFTDPQFMTSMGLPPLAALQGAGCVPVDGGVSQAKFPTYKGEIPTLADSMSAPDAILYGAYFEDVIKATISFNHFFDPQWGGGIGRGLTVGPFMGLTIRGVASPHWITEDVATYPDQFYSITKGQQALFNAFTAYTPSERAAQFGFAFQSIGHLVHHVQDMAQPQHVRNEPHLHDDVIPIPNHPIQHKWALPPAEYELRTKKLFPTADSMAAVIAAGPAYAVPVFSRAPDYFSNVTPYSGMADFTAMNYVAFVVNLGQAGYTATLRDGAWVVSNTSPEFPLPHGVNVDGTSKRIELLPAPYQASAPGAKAYYVVGNVFDGASNTSRYNQRLARESALGWALEKAGGVRLFSGGDENVWSDGYKILFPRAVAFSAGLINHFFRGKLSFSKSSGKVWTIRNLSSSTMSGHFYVYGEEADGTRARWPSNTGFETIVQNGSLDITLADEPPASIKKLVVVFMGQLGSESDRVAGVVVPNSPPTCIPPKVLQNGQCVDPPTTPPTPASCSGPFKYSSNFGSRSTGSDSKGPYAEYVLQMGSNAGQIQFNGWSQIDFQNGSFQFYANNAALMPLGGSSLTAWSTGFGGAYPVAFSGATSTFNAQSLGTTSVRLRIYSTGATPNQSQLALAVSCPGGSADNLSTTPVIFAVSGGSQNCNTIYKFKIDGGSMTYLASSTGSTSATLPYGVRQVVITDYTYSGPACTQGGPGSLVYRNGVTGNNTVIPDGLNIPRSIVIR